MAPETGKTELIRIKQAIAAIRARMRALDECDRELTTALLTGRDADATPAPSTALPARPQQRPAPVRAASQHVRRLC